MLSTIQVFIITFIDTLIVLITKCKYLMQHQSHIFGNHRCPHVPGPVNQTTSIEKCESKWIPYARHYNPRFVLFLPHFSFSLWFILQTIYVVKVKVLHFLSLKFMVYTRERLLIKSGLQCRAYCIYYFDISKQLYFFQFYPFQRLGE